jgi:hypothetical protein
MADLGTSIAGGDRLAARECGRPGVAAGAAAASPPAPPRIVSGKALDDAPLWICRCRQGVRGHG